MRFSTPIFPAANYFGLSNFVPRNSRRFQKCWKDMKILKIFQTKLFVVVQISTYFDLLTITQFRIYGFILLIQETGKNAFKVYISKLYKIFSFSKVSSWKFFNYTYNQTHFLISCHDHHRSYLTNLR